MFGARISLTCVMGRAPSPALHGRVEGLCRRNQDAAPAATETPLGSSRFGRADRADPPLSVDTDRSVAPGQDSLNDENSSPTSPRSLGLAKSARTRDPGRR